MTNQAYAVTTREKKDNVKTLRKNGQVPCVIYGSSIKENILGKMEKNVLLKLMAANSTASLIPLDVNGETKNCVVKELQTDIYGKVIHVDFENVSKDQVMKLSIPVTFLGEEVLNGKALIFEAICPEVELQGTMAALPEHIEYDVSKMEYQDKVFAKDIKLPKDVKLMTDPETLLAIANGADRAEEEADDDAAATTEASADAE